ncbi:MAG: lipid II:glycine glycyltransferase FemX [Lachnospiraceae bacterium]|nr:lipid II:glycine glycyltransferase FemX [Lachnospiraceae bacterium]MDY5741447.1 lipid II:glycine glycyltransferase FemX [Lachnospiraceae bacterium]
MLDQPFQIMNLSEEEHDAFVKAHPYGDLLQLCSWAKVKAPQWRSRRVAVGCGGQVVAVASLLFRRLPFIGRTIAYVSRGFVCNYRNPEEVKAIFEAARQVAKEEKAILLKIDPEVRREGNEAVTESLKALGFRHHGYTMGIADTQPRFTMVTPLAADIDTVVKRFTAGTRTLVKKSFKTGLVCERGGREQLPQFIRLMEETGVRDGFTTRELSYFEKMADALGEDFALYLCRLDYPEALRQNTAATGALAAERRATVKKLEKSTDEQKKHSLSEAVEALDKRLAQLTEERREIEARAAGGEPCYLSASILTFCGQRSYYLYSGSSNDLRQCYPNYRMQWELMSEAIRRGCISYDFGGVSGYTDGSQDPGHAGLYEFKKKWGTEMVERIGEFDFVLSPFWYFMFSRALPAVKRRRKKGVSNAGI